MRFGIFKSMAHKQQHVPYLYLLHSDGDLLPTNENELNLSIQSLKAKIENAAQTQMSKLKVTQIIRAPSNILHCGDQSDKVIAVVKVESLGDSDWLADVPTINVQQQPKTKLCLMKLDNKFWHTASAQISEYMTRLGKFEELKSVLDLKLEQHQGKHVVTGGLEQINIFCCLMTEYQNNAEQNIEVQVLSERFNQLQTKLAKQLFTEYCLGVAKGEKVKHHKFDSLPLMFIAFAQLGSEVVVKPCFGWQLQPHLEENAATLTLQCTDKKSKAIDLFQKMEQKYKELKQHYEVICIPPNLPTEYKQFLKGILKGMTNKPYLDITIGKYIYLIYNTDNIDMNQVKEFFLMYLTANKPNVEDNTCLHNGQLVTPDYDNYNSDLSENDDPSDESVDEIATECEEKSMVVFSKKQTVQFYKEKRQELEKNPMAIEVEIVLDEAQNCLLLYSADDGNLNNMLKVLEEEYNNFRKKKRKAPSVPSNGTNRNSEASKDIPPSGTNRKSEASKSMPNSDFAAKGNNADGCTSRQSAGSQSKSSLKYSSSSVSRVKDLAINQISSSRFRHKCGKIISVSHQDILSMKVEVIAIPANTKLQPTGGLAQALQNVGGREISDSCSDSIRRLGELRVTECRLLTSGELRRLNDVKQVIHVAGPVWRVYINTKIATDHLYNSYFNCLEEVHKYRYQSVALPAISSGNFGAPIKDVAKCAVTAIIDFLQNGYGRNIQEISLVEIVPEKIEAFITEIKQYPHILQRY